MGNAAIVWQPFIKDVRLIFEDCKNGQVRFWCIHVFLSFYTHQYNGPQSGGYTKDVVPFVRRLVVVRHIPESDPLYH